MNLHGTDKRDRPAARLRSRRGSSSVFLCVILSALVSICFAFIYSTIEYTTASRADALMRLSGDSLLSEFDRDILDEYGLFFLRLRDKEMSSRLRQYLLFTFGQEEHVTVSDVKASGASYVVTDPGPVEEQILAYMSAPRAVKMHLSGRPGGSKSRRSGPGGAPDTSAGSAGSSSGAGSNPRISDTDPGRTLRHGPTIASLPSRQLPDQDMVSRISTMGRKLTGSDNIIEDGSDKYLLATYVLNKFNCTTNTVNGDHFFYREVEYILQGKLSDRGNIKSTATALKLLREPCNLLHIFSDPKKRNLLMKTAECMPPGPWSAAGPLTLAAGWAAAESVNDARLLQKGYRVPLKKKDDNWAISMDNFLDSYGDGDGVILPDVNEGLTYEQYLLFLLLIEDDNRLTARILDLIQINMRKNVDGSFLIGECCTGAAFSAKVNRRSYDYEKIYQRILYR